MKWSAHRILVAGLGNLDRGDDGIGPVVAAKLVGLLPADVTIVSPGGDPMSLIAAWQGFDAAICIDAAVPHGKPGRIDRFDLATDKLPPDVPPRSSHTLGLVEAIRLAQVLHQTPRSIVVFTVEGMSFKLGTPMTPKVMAQAVEVATRVAAEAERLRGAARNAVPPLNSIALRTMDGKHEPEHDSKIAGQEF